MIEQGHGREMACISKRTFSHPLEADGCTILEIEDGEMQTIDLMDDDGGTLTLKDETVCQRTQLVLSGGHDPHRESGSAW